MSRNHGGQLKASPKSLKHHSTMVLRGLIWPSIDLDPLTVEVILSFLNPIHAALKFESFPCYCIVKSCFSLIGNASKKIHTSFPCWCITQICLSLIRNASKRFKTINFSIIIYGKKLFEFGWKCIKNICNPYSIRKL